MCGFSHSFFLVQEEHGKFVGKQSQADFLIAPISAKLRLRNYFIDGKSPPLPASKNILLSDSRKSPLTPPCHACMAIQAHHHRHNPANMFECHNTIPLNFRLGNILCRWNPHLYSLSATTMLCTLIPLPMPNEAHTIIHVMDPTHPPTRLHFLHLLISIYISVSFPFPSFSPSQSNPTEALQLAHS